MAVWLKKGTMSFPKEKPLIMVGPGTGVAAFRSAIYALKDTSCEMVLLFGCRSQNTDYYY
jgi:sulfite reductase alpha subunit-like flavoprotein